MHCSQPLFNQSCTNLDEELYDSVTPDNFFKTQEEFISALGAAYTQFGNYASGDPSCMLHELLQMKWSLPTRGQDWDDGGNWRRAHLHSMDTKMEFITEAGILDLVV